MIDAHPTSRAARRQLNPTRRFGGAASSCRTARTSDPGLVPWLWSSAHGSGARHTASSCGIEHAGVVTEQLGENVNPLFNALDATFTIPWSRDAAADSA
jgi:hypothetical protein